MIPSGRTRFVRAPQLKKNSSFISPSASQADGQVGVCSVQDITRSAHDGRRVRTERAPHHSTSTAFFTGDEFLYPSAALVPSLHLTAESYRNVCRTSLFDRVTASTPGVFRLIDENKFLTYVTPGRPYVAKKAVVAAIETARIDDL